jgi:hypothetical protein
MKFFFVAVVIGFHFLHFSSSSSGVNGHPNNPNSKIDYYSLQNIHQTIPEANLLFQKQNTLGNFGGRPRKIQPPPWFPKKLKKEESPDGYAGVSDYNNKGEKEKQVVQRRRSLSDFDDIDGVCDEVQSSIEFGPSTIFKNLTDPSVYDMRKRPNTAPVIQGPFKGRPVTTEQDNVTFAVMLSSVDMIDMKNEEITMRFDMFQNIKKENKSLHTLCYVCLCIVLLMI